MSQMPPPPFNGPPPIPCGNTPPPLPPAMFASPGECRAEGAAIGPAAECFPSNSGFEQAFDDAPQAPAHSFSKGYLVLGACALLIIGGLIFSAVGPDDAQATTAPADYATMTCDQLAQDGSMPAARELSARLTGEDDEQAGAAAAAMEKHANPRLARNMAMCMAQAQNAKAAELQAQAARAQQMSEEGYDESEYEE